MKLDGGKGQGAAGKIGGVFEGWRPSPTVGLVPRRAERFRFLPIWLPSKPDYARDARVVAKGKELWQELQADRRARGILNDPWARRYNWAVGPYFSTWHKVRLAFPGFGIASGAFAIYLVLEYCGVFPADSHGAHGAHEAPSH